MENCFSFPEEGILLVDKPIGRTSFSLISALRRKIQEKKIGHTGTLDPFATGLMVLLIGKKYTVQAESFLGQDKEYRAAICLGKKTDSYDIDGKEASTSLYEPTLEEVYQVVKNFTGELWQVAPMFSAKKWKGKKLYDLARKGITVERAPVKVEIKTTLLRYCYPFIHIHVCCSKGTYIRSLAHDIGEALGCGAYLHALRRTRIGSFLLKDAIRGTILYAHR